MATATQPKPKPAMSSEMAFLESLVSATGASKAAVLDALLAAAPKIGELLKRYFDEQAVKNKAPMARIARLEQRATEQPARAAFALSRVVAGAKSLGDIMQASSVPDVALADLRPEEAHMFRALSRSRGNTAGRALAIVLASHRAMELPADDPMRDRVTANRALYQRNLKLGAVARARRQKYST